MNSRRWRPSFENPSADSLLILEGPTIGGRISASHPFSKAVKAGGKSVDVQSYTLPREYEMHTWVATTASTRLSRKMDETAAKALLDLVGYDPSLLFSDLQKLDTILDRGKPFHSEGYPDPCGREPSAESLGSAAARGSEKTVDALMILKNLTDHATPSTLIIGQLGRHFLGLLKTPAPF